MVIADYHIELKVLFSSFDTQKFNFELKIGHTPAGAEPLSVSERQQFENYSISEETVSLSMLNAHIKIFTNTTPSPITQ